MQEYTVLGIPVSNPLTSEAKAEIWGRLFHTTRRSFKGRPYDQVPGILELPRDCRSTFARDFMKRPFIEKCVGANTLKGKNPNSAYSKIYEKNLGGCSIREGRLVG